MSKEINIDNEEEILKECDFDYYYDSEVCSRELCMFYNDVCNKAFMNTKFNDKQAKIDLGRIGIILNKQHKQIADLEAKLAEKEKHNQDKISFAIEQLEKVKELMRSIDMPNKPELYNNDMFGAGFDSHYIRVERLIDNQIERLKEKTNVKD